MTATILPDREMTAFDGHEMVRALKLTGSVDRVLRPLYRFLAENRNATMQEAAQALTEAAKLDPYYASTAAKARDLSRGVNPMDERFQGKPPPNHADERMKDIIQTLTQKMGDNIASAVRLGNLQQPVPEPTTGTPTDPPPGRARRGASTRVDPNAPASEE